MLPSSFSAALVAALAISFAVTAAADGVSYPVGSPVTVYCHDAERDLVTETAAADCRGTVISEAEARAIRRRRQLTIERALAGKTPDPDQLRLTNLGAAFYVSQSGRLLSNRHIVNDCTQVMIRPAGQAALMARVLDLDARADLALVEVEVHAEPPAVAVFRSGGAITEGAAVSMAGYPDQGLPPLEPLVTTGQVIATLSGRDGGDHILVSASLRHGNSGGPILDQAGLVIGIVNAKFDVPRTYRATGRQVADAGVGIGLGSVLDFLARTDTAYLTAPPGEARSPDDVRALAHRLVARAECWK